jgi:hypothetical protein
MFRFQFVEVNLLQLPLRLNEQRLAGALTPSSPYLLQPYLGMCQMRVQFDVVLPIAQMAVARSRTKFQVALFPAQLWIQHFLSQAPEYQRCEISQLNGQPTNFRVCNNC